MECKKGTRAARNWENGKMREVEKASTIGEEGVGICKEDSNCVQGEKENADKEYAEEESQW
jgi:hypothetical protein